MPWSYETLIIPKHTFYSSFGPQVDLELNPNGTGTLPGIVLVSEGLEFMG